MSSVLTSGAASSARGKRERPVGVKEEREREQEREGLRDARSSARRHTRGRVVDSDEGEEDEEVDADEECDAEGNEGVEDQHQSRDQEEGQDQEQDEDQEEGGSPRGTKRARLNREGDSMPSGSQGSRAQSRTKTQPRDTDGYIPGSIVRIQLRNFVTYDFVEFRPGPHLNMIVGPNGTGKSSIACAICLGLNSSPNLLGRASELNAFVKLGTESGHIEIELKGPKGKPNLVIRRNLSAKSKGSTFTLNGQSASGKEISQKMLELNIQISNLCTFLPQDKVSEFAAMSPQQLLRETERAAGDEHLTSWHDTLISAGKDLKSQQQLIQEDTEQLRVMRERNEGIERDVQRYRERKDIEHEIALLNILIPVEMYREKRLLFLASKDKHRKLHEKVKRLKEKNKPAHELLQKLDAERKEQEKIREGMKKTTQAKFRKMQEKWAESEKLETDADELTSKLDALKKEEKERVRRIRSLEQDIERTRAELMNMNEDDGSGMDALVDAMRQIHLERADVIARKETVDEKIKRNIDNKARSNVQLNAAHGELKKLDDLNVRKLQVLQRWDRDTHDAVLWLRENRHRFKMEVFEPPFLMLDVPDKRFARAVEGCFSSAQLRTFVTQCEEDLRTFNHLINDTQTLGRKLKVPTWYRHNHHLVPPPLTREELAGLGFNGYALDLVNCPDGLRWFLQSELNMHRTAVALDESRVDVGKAMDMVARINSDGSGGGANFICGGTLHSVNRSKYGRHALSNSTRNLGPARSFVAQTIDPEIKRRIDENITNLNREIHMINEERQQLDAEAKSVQEEDKVFEARVKDIKERKDEIQKQANRRVQMQSKLKRNENQLENLKNQPSVEEARMKLKKDIVKISKKRIQMAREYANIARAVIEEQGEATRIGLQYLQTNANYAALEELCRTKDDKCEAAMAEYAKAEAEYKKIKVDSKALLEQSREILSDADEELRKEYNAIEAKRTEYQKRAEEAEKDGTAPPPPDPDVDMRTLAELQEALQTQQAKLDLNLNTNPGIIDQYERRLGLIKELETTLENKKAKAAKLEKKIQQAKDNWKPALEKLVASIGEKFSAAFDRIGCAGEVRISENEDFEKWAIDILVKFRSTEKLQLLTAQRQSGGERSLTTILYLMSLTEEARAPFSLVDEINQGMDQRAERMVHNSLVNVTCKVDSSQYFLITPKLLPDLTYDERMKILCVNNGEWLPEEHALGNMMNMIEGFVQRHRNRAPSTA